MTAPGVSIVVPVFNGATTLGACLLALQMQRYDGPYEIIVVDNGSTDGTRDVASKFETVQLIECMRPGPAAARNAGVRVACHDLIAFTDADCIPQPDWMMELVKGLKPEFAAIGGPLISASVGPIEDLVAQISFNQAESVSAQLPYVATANALFRREEFHEVGGFDERFPLAGGEDNDIGWRLKFANKKIGYIESARCLHQHPQTILDFATQRFRYGYGEQLLIAKYANLHDLEDIRYRDGLIVWHELCRSLRLHLARWRRSRNPRDLLLPLGEFAFYLGGLFGTAFKPRNLTKRQRPILLRQLQRIRK